MPEHTVPGVLRERRDYVAVGEVVPIRVDPADPDVWSSRAEPRSLLAAVIGGLILLPIALVVFGIALFNRAMLLRTYRHGVAVAALVVDSRHTPLAPLSRAVRCTPRDGRDRRVLTVFVPQRVADLKRGDLVWLLSPPGNPGYAVAVKAFET